MILRRIRYSLEVVALIIGFVVFRLLPLDIASAFGGVLGQVFGPFSRAHRTAERNLKQVMPELSVDARHKILSGMWNNLGRVVGEFPHLSRDIMRRRITLEGQEHIEQAKASQVGALFVSGHFANWEIAPLTATFYDLPLVLIYRAANNPVADWAIRAMRSRYNRTMYNKGREGAAKVIRALQSGHAVALLADQKMNEGIAVPFFGYPAMTAPAIAQFALRYKTPLLLARIVRTDGAYFHASVQELAVKPDATPLEVLTDIHRVFEDWIRKHPEQWFWVHNRWNFR